MRAMHILLVEDSDGDILLTTEALEEGKIVTRLSVLKDGKQAIDFLDSEVSKGKPNLPELILLDINLPKKNGHEVLQFIKQDERLKQIPVIMLTTSSSENDISLSYKNHANCYITKPIDTDDFLKAICEIKNFWICFVKLPRSDQAW